MKSYLKALIQAGRAWVSDNVFKHSAAVSFYTLFSLAPVTIIALAMAGFFFGKEAAAGQFNSQMSQLVGKEGAKAIQDSVAASQLHPSGGWATALGIVLLIVGATTVFAQLQDSLNDIWGVVAKPSRSGLVVMLMHRLLSFAMVLTVGFMLLVSLILTTALTALVHLAGMEATSLIVRGADFLSALVLVTVLFAMLFKVMPDVELKWADVWRGAFVTSLLFGLGRFGIALYLGHSTVASAYGAAGSLVALLVWIYYSSAILFFGAEFIKAYSTRGKRKVIPKETAVRVTRTIAQS
ncbi:MAG: YihY/virulence factor BrkB family protein [Opitutaceae bacterium]